MIKTRTKPNAHTDAFWEKVSDDYREYSSTHDGATRGVIVELAKQHNVARKTMYTWVTYARKYGFLEPYSHRICHLCRQPVARDDDGHRIIMEMKAGDYEEKCRELGLDAAAGHFRRAMEALERSEAING